MFKLQGTRVMVLMPPRESKSTISLADKSEADYHKDLAKKYVKLEVVQVGPLTTLVKEGDYLYIDPRTFEGSLFYEETDTDSIYMIIDERQVVGIY